MHDKEVLSPLQQATLAMVLLNAFTTPLMLSAVNVALPKIALDLNLDAVSLSWIPMAYLMASAMFVLIFGCLADMYGRKRIFLIGTSSVILTSLIAAFSNSGELLIGARFLQGVSAAMLYATQVAIVSSVFPPQKRGHAIGLTVSAIYLGLAGGPLFGGYFIDIFGWRASFVFHIPLAIIVLIIGLLKVPGEWLAEEKGKYTAIFANVVLISLYLQYIQGISASFTGVIMMTQPMTMAIFSPFAGRVSDHIEPRVIATIGMLITSLGLLMLANLSEMSTIFYIISALFVTGLGFSLFSSPNVNAIMGAVEKRNYGSATGSLATMRILGQMSSMVIVTLIFALMLGKVEIVPSNYAQLGNAISTIFIIAAVLCIPGMIFSLARGRMHNKPV
jgi:MFS family permease